MHRLHKKGLIHQIGEKVHSILKFQSYADEIQGTITLVIDTIQKSKQSAQSMILYLLPHDKHMFLVYSEVQSSFGFSAPTDIHQNEQKTGLFFLLLKLD